MCLIVFSFNATPGYRLILAANRDEFLDRPTAPMAFWPEPGGILAGRDLRAGGTWFAVGAGHRFGAVTNYRDPRANLPELASRGHIVLEYLRNLQRPEAFLDTLAGMPASHNGFNLLLGDAESLFYYSNRTGSIDRLEPGLYSLSNRLLSSRWPKQLRAEAKLASLLARENPVRTASLFAMLFDTERPADEHLPETGVGLDWERRLAPMFIKADAGYGTRSSLVYLIHEDGSALCAETTYIQAEGRISALPPLRFQLQID